MPDLPRIPTPEEMNLVREIFEDTTTIVVRLTCGDVALILAYLQLAARHPEIQETRMFALLKKAADQFVAPLEALHIGAKEYYDKGWNPDWDQPIRERKHE